MRYWLERLRCTWWYGRHDEELVRLYMGEHIIRCRRCRKRL